MLHDSDSGEEHGNTLPAESKGKTDNKYIIYLGFLWKEMGRSSVEKAEVASHIVDHVHLSQGDTGIITSSYHLLIGVKKKFSL